MRLLACINTKICRKIFSLPPKPPYVWEFHDIDATEDKPSIFSAISAQLMCGGPHKRYRERPSIFSLPPSRHMCGKFHNISATEDISLLYSAYLRSRHMCGSSTPYTPTEDISLVYSDILRGNIALLLYPTKKCLRFSINFHLSVNF